MKAVFCFTFLLLSTLVQAVPVETSAPVYYDYKIIETLPHNQSLFTQGLFIDNKRVYESSGLYGRSRLVSYPLAADNNQQENDILGIQSLRLARRFFAEGLVQFQNQLILLTWKSGMAMVFDKQSLMKIRTFKYQGQGWGLTSDHQSLIMSNGTDTLLFRDPHTFSVTRRLRVHHLGKPWHKLNELEYINGKIWANTWLDNRIIEIDPDSGAVVGILDLSRLVNERQEERNKNKASQHALRNDVLNGIAYDADTKGFWITGKYWEKLFRLELTPSANTLKPH